MFKKTLPLHIPRNKTGDEMGFELVYWDTLSLSLFNATARLMGLGTLMCLLVCWCQPSVGLYSIMSAFVAFTEDSRLPWETKGLPLFHSGSKQLSVSLRDDSTSTASSSHLDPGRLQRALANSLVGFSRCLSFHFTQPASIPIPLSSILIHIYSFCPVANIIFYTQTAARSHLFTKVISPITFSLVMSKFTVERHTVLHIIFSYPTLCSDFLCVQVHKASVTEEIQV